MSLCHFSDALWIVINFFVVWSIYLSSSRVHFKNGPEYLIRGTAQISTKYLLYSSFSLIWLCLLPIFSNTGSFLFLQTLYWVGNCVLSSASLFPHFVISMSHFSISNSILTSWLYIFIVYIRVARSFSVFAKTFISSIYIRWLFFSSDFENLLPLVHFLSTLLSGTIAITNISGKGEFPWGILLWIFTSATVWLPITNSKHLFFICDEG